MSASSLELIKAKLSHGLTLTPEESAAWHAHLQTSGAGNRPGQMARPDAEVPGKSTYQMPKFGVTEEDVELQQRNMLAPPGARVGSTGGLLPDQGDAAPAAPAPLTAFEQGQAARADGDAFARGFNGTKPTEAPPKAPTAPQAHSTIGERDPNARKPGAGQGTITRHHRDASGKKTGTSNVFGYNAGSAVTNADGNKRDFGTEGAAMDFLDAFRAPAAAAAMPAPATAPTPEEVDATARATLPGNGQMGGRGLPMLGQSTNPAAEPSVATPAPNPIAGRGGIMPTMPPNTPPSAPAEPITDFRGMGGFTSDRPAPAQLPSATAVMAAPSAQPRPADPIGFPAIPSPFDPRPAAPIIDTQGADRPRVAGMGDLRTSEGPRTAAAPIIAHPAIAMEQMRMNKGVFSGPGTPATNPSRSQEPMFPRAIWNTPMADAAALSGKRSKPFQAAADQFNPFEKRRVLPE